MSNKTYVGNVMHFVEKVKLPVYIISIATLYIVYFVVFFEILKIDDKYIRIMQVSIQSVICLFLLIRFNPFVKPELKPYDSNIIFTSAMLLLSNVIIVEIGFNNRVSTAISMGSGGVGGLSEGVAEGILAAILI